MGQSSAPSWKLPFNVGVRANYSTGPALYTVVIRNNILLVIIPFVDVSRAEQHAWLWRAVNLSALLADVLIQDDEVWTLV